MEEPLSDGFAVEGAILLLYGRFLYKKANFEVGF